MAKYCQISGKGIMSGNHVSHSHRKTRRNWKPNIQRTTLIIDGKPKKVDVCARVLRSVRAGKIKGVTLK